MLRWKLLKYFIALFPLVSILALPISEPIKKQVLDRNEVRWYRTKDLANRTETIAVKSGADTSPSKVRIKVGLPPNLKSVVSDYDFRVFENGPKESFLNYVVDSRVLPGPEKKDFEDILRITDRHSKNRTLYAIDKALDESLQSQLKQSEIPRSFMTAAGNQQWDHDLWVKNCIDQKIKGSSCKEVDTILNKWEFSRLCLWSGAEKRWREDTGVAIHTDNQISPNGDIYFDVPLGTNDSGFLTIHYGLDHVEPPVNISSADGYRITKVNPRDLSAGAWWINPYYYTVETVIAVGLIILCVLIAWPSLRPLQYLPIYKIFNTALKTNDEEVWDLAFKKYRYFIIVQFKKTMSGLQERMSNDEVLDFIKYAMRGSFGKHSEKFRNDKDLDQFIKQQLKKLVVVTAYANA